MSVLGNLFGKKKEEIDMDEQWVENSEESDLEYIVIPNRGIVVCKIHNCSLIPILRIMRYTNEASNQALLSGKYEIPDVFIGVARCAPDDEWDEEYGKKLALTKAKARRCRAVNNAVKEYIRDTQKQLDVLKQYGIREVPDPKQI